LAYELVAGKSLLESETLRQFEYHLELFHGCATILHDIANRTPQARLEIDSKNNHEISENGHQILEMLSFVLSFVKKTGIGNPAQHLLDYCEQWNLTVLNSNENSLRIRSIVNVKMIQIVALYEHVEDIMSANIEKETNETYNKPLATAAQRELDACASIVTYNALCTTLRRFIFRYLTVDNYPPSRTLISYLEQPVICAETISKHFPKTILLEHTYQAYIYVRNKFESEDQARNARNTAGATAPRPVQQRQRSSTRGKINRAGNM